MITEYVQGLAVRLKAFHDLSWVERFGRPFLVLDQLSSGMLCFGVENQQGRLFLKYAGAPCLNYPNNPRIAIDKLKLAAQHYQRFQHPALVRFQHAEDFGSGFLLAFHWLEGLPLSPNESVYSSFRRAALLDRLRMMDGLIDLHVQLERRGLIVSGLKDSHLIYDEKKQRLTLCNMDDYLPLPALNLRGRLPGSPNYLAPEAYQKGIALDESCSAYAMGALAYTFFGDRALQQHGPWDAPQRLRLVADKAMLRDRDKRFQSVEALQKAWREAVLLSPLPS